MTAVKRSIAGLLTAATLATSGYYAGQQPVPVERVGLENHAAVRSGHWPKVRADYLAGHPACEICGGKEDLEVHHCSPFHERPELELDPTNLITLCRRHHFTFGHLERWRASNPDVRDDAKTWAAKFKARQK